MYHYLMEMKHDKITPRIPYPAGRRARLRANLSARKAGKDGTALIAT